MSYPVHNAASIEQTLEQLQQRVSSIGSEVDDLQTAHQELADEVREADDRADTLQQAHENLEQAQDDLRSDMQDGLDGVAAAVRDLAAAVGWIQRRLRADHELTPVLLDAADTTLSSLAERARRGRESESVLLTPIERTVQQQRITALERLQKNIDQDLETALQHSAALATTPPGSSQHTDAAAAYRSLTATITVDQRQLPAARKAADDARQQLALDDKHRQVHGPQVMTGTSAQAQLNARLRARLDAAVADGALLPAWLTLALGHQPVGEDVAAWMDLATSLLTYRVTYEVIDSTVALGRGAHDDPRRETWRKDLDKQLRARRRWPL